MEKINFEVMKNKEGYIVETVEGQEIKINNKIFGLYQNTEKEYDNNSKWFVIDFKSGISLANGATQKEAINTAKTNYDAFMEKTATKNYTDIRIKFEQTKIDNDPYYYIVTSTNNVNTTEQVIFDTYKDANNYMVSLQLRHSNISIDKKLKVAKI